MTYLGRVAIITRTKNRPLLLERAIQSALGQSMDDWFMVIVNDGGEPAPVDELVERYKDKFNGRVGVIHNPQSLGMEAASNRGIAYGDSKYLIIHDDDDSWAPHFLKLCISELEKQQQKVPTVRGIVTRSMTVFEHIEKGNVVIDKMEPWNDWLEEGIVSLFAMAGTNQFPPIAFLYEREVIDQIGGYCEQLPVLGDWDFNLRFMNKFDIYCLPELLSFYHHRPVAQGTLGNTISNSNIHLYYTRYLQNKLLRSDVESGSMGIGTLMNMADRFRRLENCIAAAPKKREEEEELENIKWNLSLGSFGGFVKGFFTSGQKGSLVRKFWDKFKRSPLLAFKVLFSYGRYISRKR